MNIPEPQQGGGAPFKQRVTRCRRSPRIFCALCLQCSMYMTSMDGRFELWGNNGITRIFRDILIYLLLALLVHCVGLLSPSTWWSLKSLQSKFVLLALFEKKFEKLCQKVYFIQNKIVYVESYSVC